MFTWIWANDKNVILSVVTPEIAESSCDGQKWNFFDVSWTTYGTGVPCRSIPEKNYSYHLNIIINNISGIIAEQSKVSVRFYIVVGVPGSNSSQTKLKSYCKLQHVTINSHGVVQGKAWLWTTTGCHSHRLNIINRRSLLTTVDRSHHFYLKWLSPVSDAL